MREVYIYKVSESGELSKHRLSVAHTEIKIQRVISGWSFINEYPVGLLSYDVPSKQRALFFRPIP